MPPSRRGRTPRSSRSSSFAPPELRGTLGTLLRTTLAQASAVRDALERGAREGRARFDDARAERRRQEALAALGELVLEQVRRGELDLDEVPGAAEAIAQLEELEAAPAEREREREWVAPQARSRFDRRAADDGTVSSSAWTPPPAQEPAARVWRPGTIEIESTLPPRADQTRPEKRGGIVFAKPPADEADDDDDLRDYMHPDDVPPRK